jgi:hypothetical protein
VGLLNKTHLKPKPHSLSLSTIDISIVLNMEESSHTRKNQNPTLSFTNPSKKEQRTTTIHGCFTILCGSIEIQFQAPHAFRASTTEPAIQIYYFLEPHDFSIVQEEETCLSKTLLETKGKN